MHGTGIFAAQLEDIPHLDPPGYGQGMLSADRADAAFHGLCKIMIQGVRAVTLHTQAGIMEAFPVGAAGKIEGALQGTVE